MTHHQPSPLSWTKAIVFSALSGLEGVIAQLADLPWQSIIGIAGTFLIPIYKIRKDRRAERAEAKCDELLVALTKTQAILIAATEPPRPIKPKVPPLDIAPELTTAMKAFLKSEPSTDPETSPCS